ncbi:hypothetical protein GCM10010174_75970 [Kutzneria viridogrisea]
MKSLAREGDSAGLRTTCSDMPRTVSQTPDKLVIDTSSPRHNTPGNTLAGDDHHQLAATYQP